VTTNKFVFFYGGVFSQWFQHDMEIDGVIYNWRAAVDEEFEKEVLIGQL